MSSGIERNFNLKRLIIRPNVTAFLNLELGPMVILFALLYYSLNLYGHFYNTKIYSQSKKIITHSKVEIYADLTFYL